MFIMGAPMSDTHLRHNGEYVYGVTITKHEAGPPSCGFGASLGLVHSVKDGRLESVEMKISDTYGPTADEAGRSLDAAVTMWQPPIRGG
jgi:hypothetical protein